MAELTAKERIIKEVSEDREQGYGSIKNTFKQAVAKDRSITSAARPCRSPNIHILKTKISKLAGF